MMNKIKGICPYCRHEIEVDLDSKKIDKIAQSSGDSLADGLKKIAGDKQRRKDLLSQMQKNLSTKKKESDDLFKKGINDIKEKGLGDKPIRDIDL
ncbi:MAG: hypothetical protein ABII23_00685 [bacterium]